jgi:polyadenylation factor subunit 2
MASQQRSLSIWQQGQHDQILGSSLGDDIIYVVRDLADNLITALIYHCRHHHKNTIQALSWSPNGNMLASASRDSTVRVFDIRAMKEFRILRGHKKEVCCKLIFRIPTAAADHDTAVEWHPFHPLLVSGGSEGSILHWDLSGADPPTAASTTSASLNAAPTPVTPAPRAMREQAHDSNVWALAFHPLGHLLVSASNDHTTRFWARERPGEDARGAFAAPGDRPAAADMSTQDDDDDALPGFGFGSGPGAPASAGGAPPGLGWASAPGAGMAPGAAANGAWAGRNGAPKDELDDFIPGFGGGVSSNGPPPMPPPGQSQFGGPPGRDQYGGPPPPREQFGAPNARNQYGGQDEWDGRDGRGQGQGQRGRQSRWGPRRGGY